MLFGPSLLKVPTMDFLTRSPSLPPFLPSPSSFSSSSSSLIELEIWKCQVVLAGAEQRPPKKWRKLQREQSEVSPVIDSWAAAGNLILGTGERAPKWANLRPRASSCLVYSFKMLERGRINWFIPNKTQDENSRDTNDGRVCGGVGVTTPDFNPNECHPIP